MTDKKKPKRKVLSKRTQAVNKAAKKTAKLIKKGKGGSANASGVGKISIMSKVGPSSLTGSRQPANSPKFTGNSPGSGGNLVKKKVRKKK